MNILLSLQSKNDMLVNKAHLLQDVPNAYAWRMPALSPPFSQV